MTDVSAWNAIDASNTATPPDGWPEGMQPSAVNDTARMMMGALRREHDRIVAQVGSTAGAVTATNITVSGSISAGGTISATGNSYAATSYATSFVGGTFAGSTLYLTGDGISNANFYMNGACVVANGVQYPPYGLATPATNIGFGYDYSTGFLWTVANGVAVGALVPNPSDERLKRDIEPVRVDPLADLCRVGLHSFDQVSIRNNPADGVRHYDVGFIAQQLREVIPTAVIEPPMQEAFLQVDLMPLVAYCVGAIQQLAARVAQLEEGRT